MLALVSVAVLVVLVVEGPVFVSTRVTSGLLEPRERIFSVELVLLGMPSIRWARFANCCCWLSATAAATAAVLSITFVLLVVLLVAALVPALALTLGPSTRPDLIPSFFAKTKPFSFPLFESNGLFLASSVC